MTRQESGTTMTRFEVKNVDNVHALPRGLAQLSLHFTDNDIDTKKGRYLARLTHLPTFPAAAGGLAFTALEIANYSAFHSLIPSGLNGLPIALAFFGTMLEAMRPLAKPIYSFDY